MTSVLPGKTRLKCDARNLVKSCIFPRDTLTHKHTHTHSFPFSCNGSYRSWSGFWAPPPPLHPESLSGARTTWRGAAPERCRASSCPGALPPDTGQRSLARAPPVSLPWAVDSQRTTHVPSRSHFSRSCAPWATTPSSPVSHHAGRSCMLVVSSYCNRSLSSSVSSCFVIGNFTHFGCLNLTFFSKFQPFSVFKKSISVYQLLGYKLALWKKVCI